MSEQSLASRISSGYATRRQQRAERQQERLYYASQRQLLWHGFKKHKLAVISLVGLLILYLLCVFADFFAPYDTLERFKDFNDAPPTVIHFSDENGAISRPFVYARVQQLDTTTFKYQYTDDTSTKHYVGFFVPSDPYNLLGFIPMQIKLFGVEDGNVPLFIFGTDHLGRDLFSRILFAGRISLFIGLGGVFLTFLLGAFFGGISGYYGGVIDEIIQRIIEVLISVPDIPLWIALSAALPRDWNTIKIYFAITIILAIRGWTGLARVVRGKIISLRTEEFALAAKAAGASDRRIIFVHLLPAFSSYLIVHITLAIPGMILGETALSFLGLGSAPPQPEWGYMLNSLRGAIYTQPWVAVLPGFLIFATSMACNLVSDAVRDALDIKEA